MTVEVILRPQAESDIQTVRRWYEEQRDGLGEEFIAAVQERLEAIRQFPEVCPAIYKRVRRAVVLRTGRANELLRGNLQRAACW